MPELPEVETVRATLAPRLLGQTVTEVWRSNLPLHQQRPDVAGLRAVLVGRRVETVDRRGKMLRVTTAAGGVLVHLGMTGRLSVEPLEAPLAAHTHFRARLSAGGEWRMVDPRRFGMLQPYAGEVPDAWAALGPDPTDAGAFTAAAFSAALSRTRRAVKLALLDQAVVAGLGNIYVVEALFRCGVHPARPATSLRDDEVHALHAAVVDVVAQGIRNRGTTLRDYVDADGQRGDNQQHLSVYGRAGEPCRVCGAPVRGSVMGQRSTFFCATCQPRRPVRRKARGAAPR